MLGVFTILLVCFLKDNVSAISFPGPRVYVVTPAPRPFQVDRVNSAPFYYNNWLRRIDSGENATLSISTTTTPKIKTPDLIFAEFESDGSMKKSIRKLLEKEKIELIAPSSTAQPIYVPDDEPSKVTRVVNYGLPISTKAEYDEVTEKQNSEIDYYSMFNSIYSNPPGSVYLPTTSRPSTTITSTTLTTTTSSPQLNVENIWHIIDNEKLNQYSGNGDEISVPSQEDASDDTINDDVNDTQDMEHDENDYIKNNNEDEEQINDNFALPGFVTNSGSGAENESRAIRNDLNIRFPYVNLKPFQMKNLKKPILDFLTNSKKGNNLNTNMNNFFELKNPVRGEVQDVNALSPNQQIDRYNPAQPYLPQPPNSKSKQSNPIYSPPQATANLVPPPPPPPPKGSDFPSPTSYESFPPYSPTGFGIDASPSLPPPTVVPSSNDAIIDTYSAPNMDDDGLPMDIGYPYKPPSPPQFLPTAPPVSEPLNVNSYVKPSIPAFQGYSYNKPEMALQPPDQPKDTYDSPPSYGPSDSAQNYDAPPSDHDFPSDNPGYFYDPPNFYNHDHHHYHPTTTTEMPRVNRFSYYYLGKKLYYLPLYFSVYFIVYVGALIIKAVLRHKIVYPNSWKPNTTTATFFSKRSVDNYLSYDNIHEMTGRITHAITTAAERYMKSKRKPE